LSAEEVELVPEGGVFADGEVPVESQELVAEFVIADEEEEAEVGAFVRVVAGQGGCGEEGLEAVVVAGGEGVAADEGEFSAGQGGVLEGAGDA
jgi:hypothetical protein